MGNNILDTPETCSQHKLYELMYGDNWRKELLVELAAYLDESGKHDGSKILTVSGYLSQVEQWVEFRRAWEGCLSQQGLKNFHMTDFDHPNDVVFKHWTKDKKIELLRQLIKLIHERLAYGICIAVNLDDLNKVFNPRTRRDLIVIAYSLGVMGFTNIAHFWSRDHGSNTPIAYFVEAGSKLGRIVPHVWTKFNAEERQRLLLGPLTWADKKDKRYKHGCEAADILAYEGQKFFSGRKRKSFEVLKRPTDWGYCMGEKEIYEVLQDFIPPEQRESYLKKFESEDFDESPSRRQN